VQPRPQMELRGAARRAPRAAPPPLGLDSDGGEFINNNLTEYCRADAITFTRNRPCRKNDACHVEQKNWSVGRRETGYGRYDTEAERTLLALSTPTCAST
jgi:hypothetical protein